jgi:hypothetical protein
LLAQTFSQKSGLKLTFFYVQSTPEIWMEWMQPRHNLLKLTADCRSIDLSEDEWRTFLNEIRAKNPDLKSNYLLPGDICTALFSTIEDGDYVLELPIDGDMEEENVDV